MTVEELIHEGRGVLRKGFLSVLRGDKAEFKMNGLLPSNEAYQALTDLGAESLDDTETNGWQGDAWTTFKFEGREFILATGAFYGEICLRPEEQA